MRASLTVTSAEPLSENKSGERICSDISLCLTSQIHFEDVFGEPDGLKSNDCVWRNSFKCFNGALSCWYKFLTVMCALPIACCWGLEFACLACSNIWCWTPYVRALTIQLFNYRRLLVLYLDTCVAPYCETCGLCLSKIAVRSSNV